MNTTDVLRSARSIMRERGMTKFTLQDSEGKVCVNGALMVAVYGQLPSYGAMMFTDANTRYFEHRARHLFSESEALVRAAIPAGHKADSNNDLIAYNNHPDTTADDMDWLFGKAIANSETVAA